jgi:Zn finger protein HypA/HybF involved in hydrogenase expression
VRADRVGDCSGVRLASARAVHELALMEDLVATVTEEIREARVHVVRLVVGRGACVSPSALRFCFDVCTHGTPLEGATLEIAEGMGDELRLEEVEVT